MKPEITAAANALLTALREGDELFGQNLTFDLVGDKGEDYGSWEISVNPTRLPEDRKITREPPAPATPA